MNIYVTQAINKAMQNDDMLSDVARACEQFNNNDWGIICDEDKAANDADFKDRDGRIVARYSTCNGDIYIIGYFGDTPSNDTATVMYCNEY